VADGLPMIGKVEKTDPPNGNGYKIRFKYKDHDLGRQLEIHFKTSSESGPCSKNCVPGGPDCDPPEVTPEYGTGSIPNPDSLVPGDKIVFRIQSVGRPTIVRNCKIFHFRWCAWLRGLSQPFNPMVGRVDANGHVTPVAEGDVTAEVGEAPDFSGEFSIRVCCVKGEKGCELSTMLVPAL